MSEQSSYWMYVVGYKTTQIAVQDLFFFLIPANMLLKYFGFSLSAESIRDSGTNQILCFSVHKNTSIGEIYR